MPLMVGQLGPHLTQCRLTEAYLRAKWYPDPSNHLATIDMGEEAGATIAMGRKVGAVPHSGGGGSWVPI